MPPAQAEAWRTTDVLIIDEISMISADVFETLEQLARALRNKQRIFGGIQLVLSGDFFQLPPVFEGKPPLRQFAFESAAWKSMINTSNMYTLRRVFRQGDDEFVRILQAMRLGYISERHVGILGKLSRPLSYAHGIPSTELFGTNAEVDRANAARLAQLHGSSVEYTARDTPGINANGKRPSIREVSTALDRDTRLLPLVKLKIGAVVMLVCNAPTLGLANGSCGTITAFLQPERAAQRGIPTLGQTSPHSYPIVRFRRSRHSNRDTLIDVLVGEHTQEARGAAGVFATRAQVPLILGWALTIHKAQGQTLDRVKVDLSRTFAEGQVYVALSRASSMATLEIQNLDIQTIDANDRVSAWHKAHS